MKSYEEMTEEERMEFVCSLERNDGNDPFIRTKTIEEFECAIKCMGFYNMESFTLEMGATFDELKDCWWLVMGGFGQPMRLYTE